MERRAAMNMKNTPEGTIRGALRYPAFRALLAGLAVSQAGDWLYNIALVTLVYQRTGSAMWAGVTTAARIVPMVVLGPFGGIVADRFDRRRVMVACDLIRLVLMLALALVTAANLPVVLAPVMAATTPRLVAGADLPGANAARAAVTGAGIIAGPALGGVLLLLGQPALAFVVNAATFGAAAVGRAAAPGGGRRGGAAGAPGGGAAGRCRHRMQPGLRHADGAVHPRRPVVRARPAGLRLPVRRAGHRRPGRHRAGQPGGPDALPCGPGRDAGRGRAAGAAAGGGALGSRRDRPGRRHRHRRHPGPDYDRDRAAANAAARRVRPGL